MLLILNVILALIMSTIVGMEIPCVTYLIVFRILLDYSCVTYYVWYILRDLFCVWPIA